MAESAAKRKDIVLIVEDEQIIARAASVAVSKLGLRAVVAENGAVGMDFFVSALDEICLVLADVVMPVISGIEMAERILTLSPDTKVLLMTGYSDNVIQRAGWRRLPLIRKPFRSTDLVRKIQELLLPPQGALA